jgi:hypothetical protein
MLDPDFSVTAWVVCLGVCLLNFLMQFSPQPGRFRNWSKVQLDPDFSVAAWVVSNCPHWGRTPSPTYPRWVEGCVGSFSLGLGEEYASAVGAGRRRGYQAMKVEGDFWPSPCCLLYWQGAHSKVAYLVAVERNPFRRAHPYCLFDWQRAQAPLGGLVILVRVDEKQIRSWWYTISSAMGLTGHK